MSYLQKFLVVIVAVHVFISCQSNLTQTALNKNSSDLWTVADFALIRSLTGITVDTGNPFNNYIALRAEHTANSLKRDSSYQIDLFAKFTANNVAVNVGPVYLNSRVVNASAGNVYHYTYKDSTLSQGKSLFGTTVTINIPGVGASPTSRTIYMPKEILPPTIALPNYMINRSANLPLTWSPDPNNQYQKVQITIGYYAGMSKYDKVGMPDTIPDVSYAVADNGSYTIPASDLTRFPKGCYVRVSIARASYFYGTNNVNYLTLAEAHSVPTLVIDNVNCDPSRAISGPNILCGTSPYSIVSSIPPSASGTWTATPSGIVTISGVGPTVSVAKVAEGNVTLSTTVSNCADNRTSSISRVIHAGGYNPVDYPISGPSTACKMTNVTYTTATLVGATNYTWTAPPGWTVISGQNTPSITLRTGTISTTFQVSLKVANACDAGGALSFKSTLVNSCGAFAIAASPNPVTDNLDVKVQSENNASNKTMIYEISIVDQLGIPIKSIKYASGVNIAKINVSALKRGTYVLNVYDGVNWVSRNIIK